MTVRINLMSLDGVELSDHGRSFSSDRVEKIVKVELANGNRKQYVKDIKRNFKMQWKWLPNSNSATSDGNIGRDSLKNLCMDGNTHILVLRDLASGLTQTFTVFVDSYSEDIARRDYISGLYFYNISVELSEQ